MEKTGIIDVDGFKLRYSVEGSGQPAIVIGSSIYYPRSFSQNLHNELCLFFTDWRGFVPTPAFITDPVTFDTLLGDIEICRQKLGLDEMIIIGHSAHALMALEYAKRYPSHVSHVVMIGISPNLSSSNAVAAKQNWEESVWPERKVAFEKRIQLCPDEILAKLPPDQRFVEGYIRRDPQAWYDFQFNSSALWKGVVPNMDMFDYLYGVALLDIDITKGLEHFNKPVFLALGRYDFIVAPPSSWDCVRDKFQDLTVRVFEHSGHSPQFEEPELFKKEVMRWLSQR